MVEQTKFEYSPLGKIFNERLEEGNKKDGILKRLNNIEGKNKAQLIATKEEEEKQLKAIENKIPNSIGRTKKIPFKNKLSLQSKRKPEEIAQIN